MGEDFPTCSGRNDPGRDRDHQRDRGDDRRLPNDSRGDLPASEAKCGQHGQIVVDELNGDMRVAARQAEFRDLPTTRYGMPADIQQLTIEPADTIVPTMAVWSALLDAQPCPDGAAGLHALSCLVAAHRSHENGGREQRLADLLYARCRGRQ